jgi:hypothetical protein
MVPLAEADDAAQSPGVGTLSGGAHRQLQLRRQSATQEDGKRRNMYHVQGLYYKLFTSIYKSQTEILSTWILKNKDTTQKNITS